MPFKAIWPLAAGWALASLGFAVYSMPAASAGLALAIAGTGAALGGTQNTLVGAGLGALVVVAGLLGPQLREPAGITPERACAYYAVEDFGTGRGGGVNPYESMGCAEILRAAYEAEKENT